MLEQFSFCFSFAVIHIGAVALLMLASYLLCILAIHMVLYIHWIHFLCSHYYALNPVLPGPEGGFPSDRNNRPSVICIYTCGTSVVILCLQSWGTLLHVLGTWQGQDL